MKKTENKIMHITFWITLGVMITGALLWLGWDIYVASDDRPGNTISEIIREGARNSILLSAFLGILIGHWMWPSKWWHAPWYLTVGVFLVLGLMWLAFDIHYWIAHSKPQFKDGLKILRQYPIINFQIHILVGYFVWTWRDN